MDAGKCYLYQGINRQSHSVGENSLQQKRDLAVFVRDRWNNKSDTLIKSLAPWAEQLINKTLFKIYKLPGDSWQGATVH